MVELIPIIAMTMVFGPVFYWVKRRYDLKEKQLTAGDPKASKLLQAAEEERKLLVGRIENLEAIVCNNDYELNMRIAQLTAGQSEVRALGPGAAAPGAAAAPGTPAGDAKPGAKRPADDATGPTLAAGGHDSDMGEKAAAVRAAAAAPATLAPGQLLAERYLIERLLGRGGMGAVYLASDQVLGEHVALKVIAPAWHHDHDALVERFRREAAAARKVTSPHVIRIHDIGEAPGGLLYLSMEYFDAKTLAELLAGHGPLGKRELREIIGQVCDGLDAAHRASVVHRDLKPQNAALDLLLAACDHLPGPEARAALAHVVLTCREMARGGLYDQLGGGFHRYSVDAHWGVPHFEKMLYDQGQLLRTYAEAWRRSGASDDDLAWPVRDTAEWLAREMRTPEGGFYASLDADSEGEEGTFYVWTPLQVEGAPGPERAPGFCAAYDVTAGGNLEGATTVLRERTRAARGDRAGWQKRSG